MCLHAVGRVESVDPVGCRARVSVDGAPMDVSLLVLGTEIEPGTWLVIHQGFAVEVLDDESAETVRTIRASVGLTTGGTPSAPREVSNERTNAVIGIDQR
ncbi:MAG: HypC/HybG/HupF family hydrogenase formation chaperone [Acidimicrobiales bacterium]|nr:HypC/HybG/HupF family hydrogenase formation chaperone [Acidimicrobiales bacterium]